MLSGGRWTVDGGWKIFECTILENTFSLGPRLPGFDSPEGYITHFLHLLQLFLARFFLLAIDQGNWNLIVKELKEMGSDSGLYAEESGFEGTDDVSSSEVSASADHLVVMVHGILGRTDDWKFAADQFVQAFTDKVIVHCSERNMNMLTLDGVDVMGERLAEEVVDLISKRPGLEKISFIAHSVGGLVARYTIGRLYRPVAKSQENHGLNAKETIYGLKAMNLITVATPHLGSRGNKQVPFLFGLTVVEKVASLIIHLIFRRTGRHLFLTDNDAQKPPLLQRMVEDTDLHFMSALEAFERRVTYSNVGNDHIVGWRTSSIRRNSELPKWDKSLNEKYPHVVYEEYTEGNASKNCSHDTTEFNNNDMLEEKLVVGLTRLSWERVDVSFHSSKQRFAAHSIIQVKDAFMHSEGADVIQHMIDHFLI